MTCILILDCSSFNHSPISSFISCVKLSFPWCLIFLWLSFFPHFCQVGLMLRGMGFGKSTSIYLASGKIYDSERHMKPLCARTFSICRLKLFHLETAARVNKSTKSNKTSNKDCCPQKEQPNVTHWHPACRTK